MTAGLRLALRALRARSAISLAILLLAAATIAAAATGPVFVRAAGESVLQDALADAPSLGRGISVQLDTPPQASSLPSLTAVVDSAVAAAPTRILEPAITGLQVDAFFPASNIKTQLVSRERVCDHLRLVAGRCPTAAGEVLVSASTAAGEGLRPGDRLALAVHPAGQADLTVVGVYEPVDPAETYWFARGYFPTSTFIAPSYPAVFTPPDTFDSLPGQVRAVLDLPIDPARVRLVNAAAAAGVPDVVEAELARRLPAASVTSTAPEIFRQAAASRDALRLPVLLVVLQLLVLALLVLLLVVAGATDARGGEVALAKVRGFSPSATLAFGLAELGLLLLAAVPLGVGGALLVVRLLARLDLRAGTPVVVTGWSLLAAAAALVGAGIGALLAARGTLRRPVLEEWRHATRSGGARSALVDGVVATLAVAGVVELRLGGGLRPDRVDVVALLAPGLVALALALLGARLLPLACRLAHRPTRARRGLALFLAVRQVARRPAGLRAVVAVAIAFGLGTFAVAASAVGAENRQSRALTETGAARVLTVSARTDVDLQAAVRRAAPDGQAMAVTELNQFGASPGRRSTLAVDSERLADVAYWRPDFGPGPLRTLAARLHPPAPRPVLVTGDAVRLDLSVERLDAQGPVSLQLELQRPDGQPEQVDLGPVTAAQHQAALAGCTAGPCRVLRIRLVRDGGAYPVGGALVWTGIEQHAAAGWTPVDAGFGEPGRWRPLKQTSYSSPDSLAYPGGLRHQFAAPVSVDPGLRVVDTPVPLPALVTPTVIQGVGGGPPTVTGLDAEDLVVDPVAVAGVLPRVGTDGAIVDRTFALRVAGPLLSNELRDEVWVAPGEAPALPERLRAEGVVVTATDSAAQRAAGFARQGPALALALFVAAGIAAAVLAVAGAVVNLALAGRRRGFELAALRVVGVRGRTLLAATVAEQALLLGTGAVLGVLAGLAGARLALPSVPQYVDQPAAPALVVDPPPGPVLLAVAAGALLVALGVAVASALLVRAAGPERLREVQA